MSLAELFNPYSHSVTKEAEIVETNKQTSYESFISTSYYLRDAYLQTLKEHFECLKLLWLEETKFSSNMYITTNHPAHLEILRLGTSVLKLILEDLAANNNHWFITLTKITGVNPIPPEHAGDVEAMRSDWVNWGKENNII